MCFCKIDDICLFLLHVKRFANSWDLTAALLQQYKKADIFDALRTVDMFIIISLKLVCFLLSVSCVGKIELDLFTSGSFSLDFVEFR